MAINPVHLLLLSLLLLHFSLPHHALPNPDTQPLLSFKSSSDPLNNLHTWTLSTDPCTWPGVTCLQNRVTHLVLESLHLTGSLQPLTSLTRLRVLSLKNNNFTALIPDLSNLTSLKLLFLSHNDFSGDLPPSISSLPKLYRLDLSYNNFSGQIPAILNRLTHLLTLRLEANRFSGPIPGTIDIPGLQDFNVSGNRLVGQIPSSLSGFSKSAFGNNLALCGLPLNECKPVPSDPTQPGSSSGALATPAASIPSTTATVPVKSENPRHVSKISRVAVISIIIGDVTVLGVLSFLLYCYVVRRKGEKGSSSLLEGEKIVYSSSPYPAAVGQQSERGKMVFFEGARRFELEDLLRASAEMLGKGGFGTAYKAVLDDGEVVAVKRLKEGSGGGSGGKREFEQQMEVLGRLRHPNIVGIKAYYFAREEKLLVFDYMPNGSLFWLLHGKLMPNS